MKALILAGGKGIRLKPLTNTMTKQLIPLANKPILHYVIDQVNQTGIRDIGIIISPETGESVINSIGDGSKWNAKITYILQAKPLGLAHAVKTASNYLNNEPFLMYLGDTLVQGNITPIVETFNPSKEAASIFIQEVKDPSILRITGVVELDEFGMPISLEEKPEYPKSNYSLIGVYLFSHDIHKIISEIKPSKRGELEITDAIQGLIQAKLKVTCNILDGWWLDTGKKDDLLNANRLILDKFTQQNILGFVDGNSTISGSIEINNGTIIKNSTLMGPISIDSDCVIQDSHIGPFTSIGKNSKLKSSTVSSSVILENCTISGINQLEDSLIGKNVVVNNTNENLANLKLFVGDDSIIEL